MDYLGEIRAFGFDFVPQGWLKCDGSEVDISSHMTLFSIIGTRFGGDGRLNFRVPDLNGVTPTEMKTAGDLGCQVKLKCPGSAESSSVPVNYCICAAGAMPPRGGAPQNNSRTGTIAAFAFGYTLPGWQACDGRELKTDNHPVLFKAIGYRYGGSGGSFALPDMRMKLIKHRKDAGDFYNGRISEVKPAADSYEQTALALNFCISEVNSGIDTEDDPMIGTIQPFGGESVGSDWLPCDGEKLNISQNPDLFSLLGTRYGGDGRLYFCLPDLRGKVTAGDGAKQLVSAGAETVVKRPINGAESIISVNYCININGIYPLRK